MEDVSRQIDPSGDNRTVNDNAQTAQEQAAGLAKAAQNSEVREAILTWARQSTDRIAVPLRENALR